MQCCYQGTILDAVPRASNIWGEILHKLMTHDKYISQIATLLFKGVWLLWPLLHLSIL